MPTALLRDDDDVQAREALILGQPPRIAPLEPTDYPALVPEGSQVPTIAVPTFLAAYNWPRNSDRHKRMERFVDRLFSRLETLQGPGFDGKWKGVNLASKVPGLERYRSAQEWLDRAPAVDESGLTGGSPK